MNDSSCLIMESGDGFRSRQRERTGDAASPSDEILMGRIVQGDHDAFSQLVHRHTPRMYAIARRIGVLSTEAEEVVQEAFLRVWVNAATWSPQKGGFAVWLGRIVVNLCIDRLRRDRYEPWGDEEPSLPAADLESTLFLQQQAEQIARAIEELPVRQRTALVLCYYEGFSNAEAAGILEISVSALEALLVRARRALRERLAPLIRT
ncbi:RNA polymerase sigma-70 factor, ECF family protein [Methylocaldum marinum]|uniref:RNA polymerase sigma-70 factor, ECF family protein n=1 Tax=Methylocaldum marinum TaxID=1432792 RepID=A0A250KZQ3_9GAMM|nr:sigma-70 family RNA polymerase sigma factor [Methylocaldum marinum]BBA37072.1 RNA polymerase sigma-70 factor, ECF family protein [Methylocaldum marinum]